MRRRQLHKQEAFRFRRFERKSYSAFNSMHRCVTIGVLGVALVALGASRKAQAQDACDSIPLRAQLHEVEISEPASEPLVAAGLAAIVLTRQDIEALHAESVQQLLADIVGVDLQQRGAGGTQADVALRGGTFDQTAVLLNGINLTSPHTGHYSLDIPVSVSDIERIEILRGPAALAYGASAFSGGINFITKHGARQRAQALVEAGQYAYWNVEASLSRQWGRDENQLSLSRKSSKGYMPNSDFENYNVLYQNRLHTRQGGRVDFQAGYGLKDYGASTFYSARFPNQHDRTQSLVASVQGALPLPRGWRLSPQVYGSLHGDEFELERGISKPNSHLAAVLGGGLSASGHWGAWGLALGGDARHEGIRSSVLGDPMPMPQGRYDHRARRAILSYYLQGGWRQGGWRLTAGALGFQVTGIPQGPWNLYPTAEAEWRPDAHWTLRASAGMASRLPTYTELYYQDAVHAANPHLRQEKSRSAEVGARWQGGALTLSATLFCLQGRDLIDWMKTSTTDEKWQSRNLNAVSRRGAETQARVRLSALMPALAEGAALTLGYAYLDQSQRDPGYISAYALNYLRHKLTCALALPVGRRFRLNVAGRYCAREGSFVSYQQGAAGSEQAYQPYFVLDANVSCTLGRFTLLLSATNLLNADYYDIGNVPQPGRWATGGVKVTL